MSDSELQNKNQDEGIDFTGYHHEEEVISPVRMTIEEQQVVEGGFIMQLANKLFGEVAGSALVLKIILGAVCVILVMLSIVAYIFIGQPVPDQQKKFVPNVQPKNSR